MGLLDNLLGRGQQSGGRGMSPMAWAAIAVLLYQVLKNRKGGLLGGGAPDNVGSGGSSGSSGPRGPAGPAAPGGGLGDLFRGGLGGFLGGAAGGALSGGLSDLLEQFQKRGQGDKVRSWIAHGPNQEIAPRELEEALGSERLQWLTEQTGLPRNELLAGLSRELPNVVDQLTPDGRLPSEQDFDRMTRGGGGASGSSGSSSGSSW